TVIIDTDIDEDPAGRGVGAVRVHPEAVRTSFQLDSTAHAPRHYRPQGHLAEGRRSRVVTVEQLGARGGHEKRVDGLRNLADVRNIELSIDRIRQRDVLDDE